MQSAPSRATDVKPPPVSTFTALAALGLLTFAVLWSLHGRLSPAEVGEGVVLKNVSRSDWPSRGTVLPSRPIGATAPPHAAASLDGLVLRGISYAGPRAGSVILGSAEGADRVVTIGRELRPGARLKEVGPFFAVISTSAGDVRMELGRSGSIVADQTSPLAASSAQPGNSPAYYQTVDYRLGLQPVKSDGRINGFALKPKAVLPQLQRAGLRPGDILLAVNGQALASEEKLLELANEIATSRTAEFEFIRGGKKMSASLSVQ